MNSKLIYLAPLVSLADAAWGFGWTCPDVPKIRDFNKWSFGGHWYEIYRDWDHDNWSDQDCTEDWYDPKDIGHMTLTRKYKYKSWFFDIDGEDWPKNVGPKWFFGDGDKDYIDHGLFERSL